jgi:hypothetical protein
MLLEIAVGVPTRERDALSLMVDVSVREEPGEDDDEDDEEDNNDDESDDEGDSDGYSE